MQKPFAVVLLVAAALMASNVLAAPITIDWSLVGNPGNAADPATGSNYGAVGYSYNIGTYDVTVNQYVAFLNSNDPTGANTLGLYNAQMSSTTYGAGISYNSAATAGSQYSAAADGNDPVTAVTFFDTLRFANWLGNNQVPGSTETGAYTLLGGTPTPSNADSITRSDDATVFLPNVDEWYKAAYYDPATSSYYAYPTSSNTAPTASGPTANGDSANYLGEVNQLTEVGAYSGTTSPDGAFDMGGNVFQWNQTLYSDGARDIQGGSFLSGAFDNDHLLSSQMSQAAEASGFFDIGFRVASVVTPEPRTQMLAIIACGLLCWWRKRFA